MKNIELDKAKYALECLGYKLEIVSKNTKTYKSIYISNSNEVCYNLIQNNIVVNTFTQSQLVDFSKKNHWI